LPHRRTGLTVLCSLRLRGILNPQTISQIAFDARAGRRQISSKEQ
jgi:hypothetical protein